MENLKYNNYLSIKTNYEKENEKEKEKEKINNLIICIFNQLVKEENIILQDMLTFLINKKENNNLLEENNDIIEINEYIDIFINILNNIKPYENITPNDNENKILSILVELYDIDKTINKKINILEEMSTYCINKNLVNIEHNLSTKSKLLELNNNLSEDNKLLEETMRENIIEQLKLLQMNEKNIILLQNFCIDYVNNKIKYVNPFTLFKNTCNIFDT